ncbi:MAG: enoyl-CoA hydratase [Solirubrobacteraceae bacterium]|nr:enoyl-CoA hydratase [Solirubrobacteraceae bacterium]
MTELTTYALADGIATITLDDGKVNALSPAMQASIGEALDRAEADEAVVVLTGRAQTFSAGFDLRAAGEEWPGMVAGGGRLAERLLSFPHPTLAACNGNAIAMGAFVLLSCDVRIGVEGPFKIGLNEAAIGLTLPWFGIETARHRLTPPYFDRCCTTGVLLDPGEAVSAGFLDRLVAPDDLPTAALDAARTLAGVDRAAHTATKLRVREHAIAAVRAGHERITSGESEW